MKDDDLISPLRVEIEHLGGRRYSIRLRTDTLIYGCWYRNGERRARKFGERVLRDKIAEVTRVPEVTVIRPADLVGE